MPVRDESDGEWDDELDDADALVGEDDAEEPTLPCPYCREEIHEDAQRCPYCDRYVAEEDRPAARQPRWIIVGGLAVMYAVYRWTVG